MSSISQSQGAPIDDFLLNTLKALLGYYKRHNKRRYKIRMCTVTLGEPESFRIYKGFSIIIPKILYAI